jgi:lipopolysaccharide transport protein LptA
MHPNRPARWLSLLLLTASCAAWSLPEDAEQPVEVDAASAEFEESGVTLFKGTEDKPAVITQGSLRISGVTIRIVEAEQELLSVHATGTPASFAQQPASDQAVVHASGASILLDNVKQLLVIEQDATFRQEGREGQSHRIEYDLTTHKATFEGLPNGGRVRMNLQSRPEAP